MRNFRFLSIIFVLFAFCAVSIIGCDPPNFSWPEKIPDLKKIPYKNKTAFDKWKETRLAAQNPVLIAGAAKVDLTPKDYTQVWMAGYQANKRPQGVDGKITGRVLLLDDGKQTFVLVMADFVGYMNNNVWRVRQRVSSKYGKDIMIASTHNHAGPDTVGMWGSWALMMFPMGSGLNPAYMDRIEKDLANAIIEAATKAKPANLFASKIIVPEGISENAHKFGHKDNEMTVLQVRGVDGSPISTVLNYACHAEFLGQENDLLSPDFPGFLYDEVERREAGVALFVNGAIGGIIVPAMPRRTENYPRLRRKGAQRAAHVLAGLASQAIENSTLLSVSAIKLERKLFKVPVENEVFQYLGEKGILKRSMKNNTLYSEVWRVDLGELGLASVPGEIFPSLGFELKKMMPQKYQMIVGLGNDELGYIMSADEWTDPLYAYERTVSPGSQTGPLLMKTLGELYK